MDGQVCMHGWMVKTLKHIGLLTHTRRFDVLYKIHVISQASYKLLCKTHVYVIKMKKKVEL